MSSVHQTDALRHRNLGNKAEWVSGKNWRFPDVATLDDAKHSVDSVDFIFAPSYLDAIRMLNFYVADLYVLTYLSFVIFLLILDHMFL